MSADVCANCGQPIARHPSGWFHADTGRVRCAVELFPAEGAGRRKETE